MCGHVFKDGSYVISIFSVAAIFKTIHRFTLLRLVRTQSSIWVLIRLVSLCFCVNRTITILNNNTVALRSKFRSTLLTPRFQHFQNLQKFPSMNKDQIFISISLAVSLLLCHPQYCPSASIIVSNINFFSIPKIFISLVTRTA
jgi:hypothetical protein